MVEAEKAKGKVYASVEDMVADGASEVEYREIDGFKPGTLIRIGSVTAGDMIEWTEANDTDAKRTAGLRLITKSLVNEAGVRIATDKHIKDLRTMRHNVTERIVKEILDLNGMTVKKENEAKKD